MTLSTYGKQSLSNPIYAKLTDSWVEENLMLNPLSCLSLRELFLDFKKFYNNKLTEKVAILAPLPSKPVLNLLIQTKFADELNRRAVSVTFKPQVVFFGLAFKKLTQSQN